MAAARLRVHRATSTKEVARASSLAVCFSSFLFGWENICYSCVVPVEQKCVKIRPHRERTRSMEYLWCLCIAFRLYVCGTQPTNVHSQFHSTYFNLFIFQHFLSTFFGVVFLSLQIASKRISQLYVHTRVERGRTSTSFREFVKNSNKVNLSTFATIFVWINSIQSLYLEDDNAETNWECQQCNGIGKYKLRYNIFVAEN